LSTCRNLGMRRRGSIRRAEIIGQDQRLKRLKKGWARPPVVIGIFYQRTTLCSDCAPCSFKASTRACLNFDA
jgi:hypothetical protein